MIEINLLPPELQKERSGLLAFSGFPVRKAVLVFLAVFFGAQILLTLIAFYQKVEIGVLKTRIRTLSEANKELTAQKVQAQKMEGSLKEIQTLTRRKFFWSALLNAISDSVTKGIWLRGFSVSEMEVPLPKSPPEAKSATKAPAPARPAGGDETPAAGRTQIVHVLRLEGSVLSSGQETAAIGRFIKEMKSNAVLAGIFSDVELANITQKKIKDFDVYDFVLRCTFKKEKF